MKPPPFDYHAPQTVDEAVRLLAAEPEARVLAGGQSLVQELKFRRVRPTALIDVNGVSGLDGIAAGDGGLRLGALVRQQRLVEDPDVARAQPLLRAAARHVGYPETRRRGTIGGSMAFAAPWAELTAAAVALDATIEVEAADGGREIAAREFFRGPHETALGAGELVTALRFPDRGPRTGAACHEVSARFRDYARVAAVAVADVDESGRCTQATVVLLRVAARPHLVDATAALADGADVGDMLGDIDPPDDIEASGRYRRRVAPVLARRALKDAMADALGREEAAA
jgi:aerobic carbon-monoxide dehydrogenase medium subunit